MKRLGGCLFEIGLLTLLLPGAARSAPVRYSYLEDYSFSDPSDPNPMDRLSMSAGFTIVVPDFLEGLYWFTADQLQGCHVYGVADGAVYGYQCTAAIVDFGGSSAFVGIVGCPIDYGQVESCLTDPAKWLPTPAGALFTITPGQSGTWYTFAAPGFPPGTIGGSTLVINPEPPTLAFSFLTCILASFLCASRARRTRAARPHRAVNYERFVLPDPGIAGYADILLANSLGRQQRGNAIRRTSAAR